MHRKLLTNISMQHCLKLQLAFLSNFFESKKIASKNYSTTIQRSILRCLQFQILKPFINHGINCSNMKIKTNLSYFCFFCRYFLVYILNFFVHCKYYFEIDLFMQLSTQQNQQNQQAPTLELLNFQMMHQNTFPQHQLSRSYNIQPILPSNNPMQFKCQMIIEFLRIIVYFFSVVLLFMVVFYPKIKFTEKVSVVNELYSVEMQNIQIIVDKNMIGVYPPVNGTVSCLYKQWNLFQDAQSSVNNGYSIQLKNNGAAWIKRVGCNGEVKATWKVSFYNIFIDIIRPQQKPDQYTLQIDRRDYICINGNTGFFDELQNVTIWSFNDNNMYLLYQENASNTNLNITTQNKILIFVPQTVSKL